MLVKQIIPKEGLFSTFIQLDIKQENLIVVVGLVLY